MKAIITYLIFIIPIYSYGQANVTIDRLFDQRDYNGVISISQDIQDTSLLTIKVSHMIGRAFAELEKYDSAIPYLLRAIQMDSEHSYISGWCYAYLGKAYIMTDAKEQGIRALKRSIYLHKTDNSVKFAKHILTGIKGEANDKWTTIEGNFITYHFEDTTGISNEVNRYIIEHEEAYILINRVFQAVLPVKMRFYVWNDMDEAENILHHKPGFTYPAKCITHAHISQSIGHEMTHTLSYWAWDTTTQHPTHFITEGVAVAFDQNNNDKYSAAKKIVAGKGIHSILDIWKKDNIKRLPYPVCGAFVTYLYKNSTPEQFKQVIIDQTIENAQKVFGPIEFYKLIYNFNTLIGLNVQ